MAGNDRIGVVFCGGCNPRFDRGAALRAYRERFPGIDFTCTSPEAAPAYLVICGCQARCADIRHLRPERPVWYLVQPEAAATIAEQIAAWIATKAFDACAI